MAKRSLEEMLNDPVDRKTGRTQSERKSGKKTRRKTSEFSSKEKTRLAIYITLLVIFLAGFILTLVMLISHNPLSRETASTTSPAYSYSQYAEYNNTVRY